MESLVAEEQSALVQVDPATGLLAFQDDPYLLTIEQLYSAFVMDAPFRDERELLFAAFDTYMKQTKTIIPNRRVWVDGSFVSLMENRSPGDIDLLSIVEGSSPEQRRELVRRGLLTMSEVSAKIQGKETPTFPKFAPYGGLVDAYYVDAGNPAVVEQWKTNWSTPKSEDGQLDFSREKGFVEVVL